MNVYLFKEESLALTQCINMHFAFLFNNEVPIRFQFVTLKTITASLYRKYNLNGIVHQNLVQSSTQNERNNCAFNLIGSTSFQRFAHCTFSKYCFVISSLSISRNISHIGLNRVNCDTNIISI